MWYYKTNYSKEIGFYVWLQYLFFTQWQKLKKYANDKGLKIIGDIPIYVAYDSADVWAHPEMFQLDQERKPRRSCRLSSRWIFCRWTAVGQSAVSLGSSQKYRL